MPKGQRSPGRLRPFEASRDKPRKNSDGSYSTEITRTVETPSGWANVPSLWYNDKGSTNLGHLSDDQLSNVSTRFEKRSGRTFSRYKTLNEAETAARGRSKKGGALRGPLSK